MLPKDFPDPESRLKPAARRLTEWFLVHRRELPWRRPADVSRAGAPARGDGPRGQAQAVEENRPGYPDRGAAGPKSGDPPPLRDPYSTWIAEIMLQQTQVATVVDYFRRWMERFPDLRALAEAREEEVLGLWAGLGYYSRARNLLVTARAIMAEHGGRFPRRREELLALKGVGEYTAGAIASLAFNLPEPILDGNLVRVFSRVYAIDFLPDDKEGKRAYWDLARAWVQSGSPALINEGLMELGAMVCAPRNPACAECPLSGFCKARKEGRQESLPPPKARKQGLEVQGIALVTSHGSDVLLYRPRKGELLSGLLTFPVFQAAGLPALRKAWSERLPDLPQPAFKPRAAEVSHSITHHNFRLRLAEGRLEAASPRGPLPEGFVWVPAGEVAKALVSSLPRKVWKAFAGRGGFSGES